MSDDLRPPSLRDTRSLEDVVRHHSLLLSKLAPGLFGGRSRIPDPVELEDAAVDGDAGNDGDADEAEWWDEDRYVVTGPGTINRWTLTYVPVPESLSIRWHPGGGAGLVQISPENWTLGDDGQTVTITDPDNVLEFGDFFSAQYQFLDVVNDDPPPPPPDPLALLNILGRWDLDDTSGTTAVATLGSDGAYVNSPTLGQSPLVADGGKAVATDWNSSQDITIPLTGLAASPAGSDPAWIMFAFKYGGTTNPFSTILFRDHTSAVSRGYFLDLGHTNPIVAVGSGTASGARTISGLTSASLLDGNMHLILLGTEPWAAGGGADWALWIDGELVDSWTRTAGGVFSPFWLNVASPLHFGKDGTVSQYNSFTYDRLMVGSDTLATLAGLAADLWTAAGGS